MTNNGNDELVGQLLIPDLNIYCRVQSDILLVCIHYIREFRAMEWCVIKLFLLWKNSVAFKI